jgi:hypothetical protein
MTQSHKIISKSEIIKPATSKDEMEASQQNSISRFINFISSKVITNRIKVK